MKAALAVVLLAVALVTVLAVWSRASCVVEHVVTPWYGYTRCR